MYRVPRTQVLRLMGKMVGSIEYNKTTQTKSFRWREKVSSPMHQVTYDDKQTYRVKYRWALDNGFRGIGFWMVSRCVGLAAAEEADDAMHAQADATDGNQEAIRDMWGAVPAAAAPAAAPAREIK
jgi:GH18 family chitinase